MTGKVRVQFPEHTSPMNSNNNYANYNTNDNNYNINYGNCDIIIANYKE